MKKTALRSSVLAIAAVSAFSLGSPQANALITPTMNIAVTGIAGGFKVCGVGTAANPFVIGQWQLTASGSRSDGTPITGSAGGPGQNFNQCFNVFKNGAPIGSFEATFEFVGVGLDVAGHANKSVAWGPTIGDVII